MNSDPHTVAVDPTAVINSSTDRRLGVNCNYWCDAQPNRDVGSRSLAAALGDLGVGYLRYPGGEKADGTLFFDKGGDLPHPRLARISPADWPSNDSSYWSPPGSTAGTWARPIYDFDQFMADCRSVGAEPFVVVALDGIYKPAHVGGTSMTKQQAMDNAVGFVRYANITMGYHVRYWEIGNEPWQDGYMGGQADPAVYAKDFADLAAAMKSADPDIQVGASGHNQAYFRGILAAAASSVDFFTVHPYPTYGKSFDVYQSGALDALSEMRAAAAALAEFPAHAGRIWLAVTETGHLNATNDLGSAVITAHLLGQLLEQPAIRIVQFWNTRWVHNNVPVESRESNDALDPLNGLTPCGQALAVWGRALVGPMVSVRSSLESLCAFASHDASSGKVCVVVVNRSSTSASVRITIPRRTSGVLRQLSGKGPTDTVPTYGNLGRVALTDGTTSATTMPAVSITLLEVDS